MHGATVIPPVELDRFRNDALVVAAVGNERARREIRAFLTAAGWVEGRDFVAAA